MRWDDPDLAIDWPTRDVTVSAEGRGPAAAQGRDRVRVGTAMIWLVGGEGMLGKEVRTLLRTRGLDRFSTDAETDITTEGEVTRLAQARRPRWIVNCAAYTAVDRAEADEARDYAVNALGPLHLARAATAVGARLVHVSTDYAFDGQAAVPYPEDASPAPLGAYGRTRAAGDAFVRGECSNHFIVCTAWLHGPHGGNFVATTLRLMASGPGRQP